MQPYGSGHFGHWTTDEAGLPAYEYTCNHLQDPAAEYLTQRGPSRDHFHLLGNSHASAVAHNEGYIELFRPDTVGAWLNRYAPERGAYAGGFGFLRLEQSIRSTLYRHLSTGHYRRIWGIGYARKSAHWGDLAVDQLTFLPYGNDPVLVNLTTLGNRGLHPLNLSYYEYWDVLVAPVLPGRSESRRIGEGLRIRRSTRYDPERRLLLCAPAGKFRGPGAPAGGHDPDPPVAFLAAIDGHGVSAFETSHAAFFGEGGLEAPSALALPFLQNGLLRHATRSDRIILVLQRNVAVPPGGSVRLAHIYGYGSWDSARRDAKGSATPRGLVERYAARSPGALLQESLEKWRESLLHFEAPEDDWVAREAAWNSYYGQALASLDSYTGETFLDQGGLQTYELGRRSPPRDPCRHALALLPNNPAQVRGTIRHLTRLSRPDGSLAPAWATQTRSMAKEAEPSDLHLWLLWLIADYTLLYRDRAFVDQEVPLYPRQARKTTSIRQQVRRSLDYLSQVVGRGRHGMLRLLSTDGNEAAAAAAGPLGRWRLQKQGESTYNSGLAGVVLPRVAELCRWLGEAAWAEEVTAWAEENRLALKEAWNGHWFDRILAPGQRVGREALFLDCQPWVVLAGAANETQQFILFHEIRERLAPHLPVQTQDEAGSLRDGLYGGVSFEDQGPLVWALAQANPGEAWEMLKASTLASHAEAPGSPWFGVWSAPDTLDPLAPKPAEPSWRQRWLPFLSGAAPGPNDFPIASGHSANQLLFALARLAGLEPDAQGYRVRPRLPFQPFAFETARLGLRWQEGRLGGYIVPQGNDAVRFLVEVPEGFPGRPMAIVDRCLVAAELSDDGREIRFEAFVRGGMRTEWEVKPAPPAE